MDWTDKINHRRLSWSKINCLRYRKWRNSLSVDNKRFVDILKTFWKIEMKIAANWLLAKDHELQKHSYIISYCSTQTGFTFFPPSPSFTFFPPSPSSQLKSHAFCFRVNNAPFPLGSNTGAHITQLDIVVSSDLGNIIQWLSTFSQGIRREYMFYVRLVTMRYHRFLQSSFFSSCFFKIF